MFVSNVGKITTSFSKSQPYSFLCLSNLLKALLSLLTTFDYFVRKPPHSSLIQNWMFSSSSHHSSGVVGPSVRTGAVTDVTGLQCLITSPSRGLYGTLDFWLENKTFNFDYMSLLSFHYSENIVKAKLSLLFSLLNSSVITTNVFGIHKELDRGSIRSSPRNGI